MKPRPSEHGEVRRLITIFVVLVIMPAVGLVAFGLVAITNERAVVEQRFNTEYAERLRQVATLLARRLDDAASSIATGATALENPLVSYTYELTDTGLVPSRVLPEGTADALVAAARALPGLGEGDVTLFGVRAGPARGLHAVGLARGHLRGVAFVESELSDLVRREAAKRYPSEPATFTLEGPRSVPPGASAMRRVVEEFTSSPTEPGLPSLALPGPLADWRIVATLPGSNPVKTALWRTRAVYITILSLFYVVLAFGIVFTLRGIWREVRLSRLKTDFVSNISHELRTPLTSIRMFAETLRLGRAQTDEERDACLAFIITEAERLTSLTERTLDWARVEAGSRRYQRVPTAAADLVGRVCERFLQRGLVPRDHVTVELAPDLPVVDVDADALEQVFSNLLENAVKYTLDDKRITVRATRDRGRLRVEVVDNGIGIHPREHKRVFERFYRADDLLARRTEGSGLGLSIARRIVEAHHGRLTLKSRPHEGSTFVVELPASRTPTSRAPALDAPPERPT